MLSESQTEDRFPIIFLKDVKFNDLECLINYIYTGKTSVNSSNMSSCVELAEILGISGFAERHIKVAPNKRKSAEIVRKSAEIVRNSAEILNKENASPTKIWSNSEPVPMPSVKNSKSEEKSPFKKRKIHSLDSQVLTPPPAFISPKSPRNFKKSADAAAFKKSHIHSLPVESSPILETPTETMTLPRASMLNNLSFNSTFPVLNSSRKTPDPESVFRGANLLQTLALWMVEEQKNKSEAAKIISDPPPAPPNSLKSNPDSTSRRRTATGESESGDRPDSGFDSKDEEDIKLTSVLASQHQAQISQAISEEAGIRTASSGDTSPELSAMAEISRQAPIRQPVMRKRRLNH